MSDKGFIRKYYVIQNLIYNEDGTSWEDFESHLEYDSEVEAMVRIREFERNTRLIRERPDSFRIDCRYDLEVDG